MKIIFMEFHSTLCHIAFRVLNDEEDAKDIVQDVFLKLWRGRETFVIQTSLAAYLKRAVINTALNFIEKNKKVRKTDVLKSDLTAFSKNDVEQDVDLKELNQDFAVALESLPTRTKAVFSLVRFEEMSYKEVADALDISTKAVEKEMMKALRLLREALKNYLISLILILLTQTCLM